MPATKRTIPAVLGVLALCSLGAGARTDTGGVFKGEIADSQCAMNVHSLTRSHKEMLKSHHMGKTARDCTIICVKQGGGQYVLENGDVVYKLDDQAKGEQFAGEKVQVKGTLDTKTNTIHVISMQADTK